MMTDREIEAEAERLAGICIPGDPYWRERSKSIATALRAAQARGIREAADRVQEYAHIEDGVSLQDDVSDWTQARSRTRAEMLRFAERNLRALADEKEKGNG